MHHAGITRTDFAKFYIDDTKCKLWKLVLLLLKVAITPLSSMLIVRCHGVTVAAHGVGRL